MPRKIFGIVTGEPALSICLDWKDRWLAANKATVDYVKSIGGTGWGPNLDGDLAIIGHPGKPDGWTSVVKKGRIHFVPSAGAKGDAVRAAIAALPKHPRKSDLPELLGIPDTLYYADPANKSSGSTGLGGGHWHAVELLWHNDDALVLRLPDVAAYVAKTQAQNPTAKITLYPGKIASWSMPDWLTPITEAEWDLMVAQAVVDRERKRKKEAA